MECQHVSTHSYIHYWLDASGQIQALAALLPEKKPLNRNVNAYQCLSGRLGEKKNLLPCRESNPYISDAQPHASPKSDGANQIPYMA
jgi:hypothetical protein